MLGNKSEIAEISTKSLSTNMTLVPDIERTPARNCLSAQRTDSLFSWCKNEKPTGRPVPLLSCINTTYNAKHCRLVRKHAYYFKYITIKCHSTQQLEDVLVCPIKKYNLRKPSVELQHFRGREEYCHHFVFLTCLIRDNSSCICRTEVR